MIDLVFKAPELQRLKQALLDDKSRESAAILLATPSARTDGFRLLVREIHLPAEGDYDSRTSTRVRLSRDFAMPLAGTVHVGGKTPDEISDLIEAKLRGPYLKDPRVAVNVKEALNQQTITVDGEVQQPGVYPVGGRLSLQQAVALARGASETANIRNVIVFRTVKNQKMAAMFDLKAIRSGRSPDPPIYGNDIVVVGEDGVQKFLRGSTYLFPVLGRFIPFVF